MVESGQAADWTCYVCRGECNCTSCRRKLLGETSTEVQSLSHPGGLFDKEPEVVDVAGGRSAAVRFSFVQVPTISRMTHALSHTRTESGQGSHDGRARCAGQG